jgi:tRNA-dihydrouridine synthase
MNKTDKGAKTPVGAVGASVVDVAAPLDVVPREDLLGNSDSSNAVVVGSVDKSGLASVMVGRGAFFFPWQFANADRHMFGEANPGNSRRQVIASYLDYAEKRWEEEKLQLEAEAAEELRAAGEGVREAVVARRVRPKLRVLREKLFQPLTHLFHGCTDEVLYHDYGIYCTQSPIATTASKFTVHNR